MFAARSTLAAFLGLSAVPFALPCRSVNDVEDLLLAADRVFAPFEASAETRRLLERATTDLRRLDLSSLHAALPPSDRTDSARLVLFEATTGPSGRQVRHRGLDWNTAAPRLFDPGAAAPPLLAIGSEPGDGWFFGAVLPLDRAADRFRVRATTAVRTGRADTSDFWKWLPGFLRETERRARDALRSSNGAEALRATLESDFPSATSFLLRYFELDGEVSWSPLPPRLGFEPRIGIRPEALGKDYPILARYVSRLTGAVETHGEACDEAGAVVADWSFRASDGLTMAMAFRDGQLLPASGAEAGHDLASALRLALRWTSSFGVFGVRTELAGIRAALSTDPADGRLAARIAGEPESIAISGRLFDVVPLGLVDFFLPGTLEQTLRELVDGTLLGREGRGVDLLVRASEDAAAGHFLQSDLVLDVSSSRLFRTALRLGARTLYPGPEESRELARFGRDLVAKLREDASARPCREISSRSAPLRQQ